MAGGGDAARAELADLFENAARDFKAIANKLREMDGEAADGGADVQSDAEEQTTVVRRKKRQKKKKSTYWTHFELNEFERGLKLQVAAGKKAADISIDEIHTILPTRSLKELEKQLEMYVKATEKDDFSDLPFMAGEAPAAAPAKKKKKKMEGSKPEDTPNTKKKKKKLQKRMAEDPPSKKSKKDKK